MQALAAALLAERLKTEFRQQLTCQARGLLHPVPAEAFAWIKIEDHPVGLLKFGRERIPGVHLDRAHLRRADQRADVFYRDERRMTRIDARMMLDVRNGQLLAVLLKEQLPADILRRTHQRHWPVFEMRQHPRRDGLVVEGEIELASTRRGIDHTIGMADLHASEKLGTSE